MVFGPIVGIIELTWPPIYSELLLTFSVSEPMEAHVRCFGYLWLDFPIDDRLPLPLNCLSGVERVIACTLTPRECFECTWLILLLCTVLSTQPLLLSSEFIP